MENKITELIEETVRSLGFELVKVALHGGSRKVLEICIDRLDGSKVQIGDCTEVSKNISAILDVEDLIRDKYFLEVSSAGAERPLVKLQDFARFIDRDVKLKLKEAHNGKFSFKGAIEAVGEENIRIKSKNVVLEFAYSNIKSANLLLTNELFRQLIKKKNKK